MAITSTTVWECRTGGSDNNGGGYDSAVSGATTDWSLQTGAHATLTAASTVHTTTTQINVAVGDYTVASTDVGNVLQITGGTATAGFYRITVADVPNKRWTLDRSAGTSTQTVVGAMGGALLTPGKAHSATVAGNAVYLKNDGANFSITSASTNVAGGCIARSSTILVGYGTTRTLTTTDSPPTLQVNVASATIFTLNESFARNVIFDGNSQTGVTLYAGISVFVLCTMINFNTISGASGTFIQCKATTNSAIIFNGSGMGCEAYANTATPFQSNTIGYGFVDCVSYANTGATTDGFLLTASKTRCVNCVAYGNGRSGFRWNTSSSLGSFCVNCIAEGHTATGAYGFDNSVAAVGYAYLLNCGSYNNQAGRSGGTLTDEGAIAYSASAFTDAAGNDFSLNATVGGGASLRGAGYPGTLPRGVSVGYASVGAVQPQYGTVVSPESSAVFLS
jgi:hypothetical protein